MDAHREEAGLTLPRSAALLLLAALAAQTGWFIVSNSSTFDEPVVAAAGYSYVKTGRLELETTVHPPLMKYLFGLALTLASPDLKADTEAFRRAQPYPYGHEFFFRNRVEPERLLVLARLPGLLLSLSLACFLLSWASRWYGPWGGVLALAAYVFEPNVLAHSGLANMDMGLSAFLFIAAFFLVRHLEEPSPRRLGLSALFAGCAAAVKIPGVFFLAWAGGLPLLRGEGKGRMRRALEAVAAAALGILSVLLLCYQFRYFPKFFGLLGQMLPAMFVPHPTEPQFNFLHGQLKLGGWKHYYLVALLVKTPLPWLLLAFLGFLRLDREKKGVVLLPALSYFLVCSLASKQNGVRYILPVFPFLCLAAGGLALRPSRRTAALALLLTGWTAVGSLSIAPNYLAYFNQFAGGPRGGYRWLVDSNLDWGQDFYRLSRLLKDAGNPETLVAVLGNGDRDRCFGPHQDLLAWDGTQAGLFEHVNSSAPAKEWLVVSASFLQGFGLSDPQAFAWLRGRPPLARPGYSTFVYDVTSDALSQYNVGLLYARNRQPVLAERQFRRAAALAPEKPHPWQALGDLYRAGGQARKAAEAYAEARRRGPL